MASRTVEIRINVDDADAVRKLDAIAAKLKKLAGITTIKLRLDDGGAEAKLTRIAAKLDKIGSKEVTPKIGTGSIDKADVEVDRLSLKLDKLGLKTVTPKVDLKTSGTLSSDLKRLLSGGGGGGGGNSLERDAAAAAGGGGGILGGALSTLGGANNAGFGGLIAGLIAYGMSIGPAIIPFGLGGLVGGGGALLAGRLGTTGLTALRGDRQAVAQAQAAIAGKGPTTPLQALNLRQAQAQLARDQAKYGGFVPFGQATNALGHDALSTFLGAITGSGPGFSAGPHGQPGGSFLSGLVPIFQQIGHFMTTLGPGLGNLFRASLPSLQAFVKIGEQFAKAVLPAMAQSLRALNSSGALPIIVQGFKLLSQGIAGFIKNLGPGMRAAAVIFKGSMEVVKGVLQLVGKLASMFADGIVRMGNVIRGVARNIPHYFDDMKNGIVSVFNAVKSFIANAWNAIWTTTVNFVKRIYTDAVNWFHKLPSGIQSALAGLPGILFGIGVSALTGLLHGLESMGSSILGYIGHLAGSIASAIAGAIPGGGAISSVAGAVGKIFHLANGGIINEPIIGTGLRTGAGYTFGEGGIREMVTPLGSGMGMGGGDTYVINVSGDFVNPDATGLRIVQAIRTYKQHHGNAVLGIA